MNTKKTPKLHIIHTYLEKSKIRGWILFPPLFFLVIVIMIGFIAHIYDISLHPFVFPIYLGFAFYLMIGVALILWSDHKRLKNKYL